MKVKITGCAADYGKVGEIVEVDERIGNDLIARGSAQRMPEGRKSREPKKGAKS